MQVDAGGIDLRIESDSASVKYYLFTNDPLELAEPVLLSTSLHNNFKERS